MPSKPEELQVAGPKFELQTAPESVLTGHKTVELVTGPGMGHSAV